MTFFYSWKKKYQVTTHVTSKVFTLCDLCYKLHHDMKPKIYQDIGEWFETKAYCKIPQRKYSN